MKGFDMRHHYLLAGVLAVSASAVIGCSHDQDMGHTSSSEMQQMKFGDAPAAVQSAVQREYPGGKVTFIAKHELGDHAHYHIELVTADGKTVYRTYSPSGMDMSDPH